MRTQHTVSHGAAGADHGEERVLHILATAEAHGGYHVADPVHQHQRPLLRHQRKARESSLPPHPADAKFRK